MTFKTIEVRKAPKEGYVLSQQGELLKIPNNWELLLPGDAALTRRVKKESPHWLIQKKIKGRFQSQGIWASKEVISRIKKDLEAERQSPSYQKKLHSSREQRAKKEVLYSSDFKTAILLFLRFNPRYQLLARELALRISDHATPVGSGTVARTQRIPIAKRAEAATIAWLRHNTTAYDNMYIPRVKGKRREIRSLLAKRSIELLENYRKGSKIDIDNCPLQKAIKSKS